MGVFFGPKSGFLAEKSDFCHTTPILINGLSVALGETVHFHLGSNFSTFRSQVMAVFVKKKRSTRQKVFPLPTARALTASNSHSAGLDKTT